MDIAEGDCGDDDSGAAYAFAAIACVCEYACEGECGIEPCEEECGYECECECECARLATWDPGLP